MKYLIGNLFLLCSFPILVFAGDFSGNFELYPEGCQYTETRSCKLKGVLTYKSSRDGLVWQTDEWEEGNRLSLQG